MKILNLILEALMSPYWLFIRTTNNSKNFFANYAKPLIVLVISLVVVTLLVIYFYFDVLFK